MVSIWTIASLIHQVAPYQFTYHACPFIIVSFLQISIMASAFGVYSCSDIVQRERDSRNTASSRG